MQTSAMNCSLWLNEDRLEKSPECWMLLAASVISFNSLLMALCQSRISSIGWNSVERVASQFSSIYFLLPILEDSHAQCPFMLWHPKVGAPESWHQALELSSQLLHVSDNFAPFIQEKITFINRSLSQLVQVHPKKINCQIYPHLPKKFLFWDYLTQALVHILMLIRWYRGRKPRKKLCHHINRNAAQKLPCQWGLLFKWKLLD